MLILKDFFAKEGNFYAPVAHFVLKLEKKNVENMFLAQDLAPSLEFLAQNKNLLWGGGGSIA